MDAQRALLIQNLGLTWRYSIGNPYEQFSFPEGVDVGAGAGRLRLRGRRTRDAADVAHAAADAVPELEDRPEARRLGALLPALRATVRTSREVTPVLRGLRRRLGAPARRERARAARSASGTRRTSPTPSTASTRRRSRGRGCAGWARCGRRRADAQLAARCRSARGAARARASRAAVRARRCGCRTARSSSRPGSSTRERPYDRLTAVSSRAATGTSSCRTRSRPASSPPGAPRRKERSGTCGCTARACSGSSAPARTRSTGSTAPFPTSGTDQVYGLNVARFLAANDRPDQLVLSLYGQLAAAMTPGTFVAGEAASVDAAPRRVLPLDVPAAERRRQRDLPRDAAPAARPRDPRRATGRPSGARARVRDAARAGSRRESGSPCATRRRASAPSRTRSSRERRKDPRHDLRPRTRAAAGAQPEASPTARRPGHVGARLGGRALEVTERRSVCPREPDGSSSSWTSSAVKRFLTIHHASSTTIPDCNAPPRPRRARSRRSRRPLTRPISTIAPHDFSPAAKRLRVHAELPAPARVGVQLATRAGKPVGWIAAPQRRRFLTLRWNGRLPAQSVAEGRYLIRLVDGRPRGGLVPAPDRPDAAASHQDQARNGSRTPFRGDNGAPDDDLAERRPAARRSEDPLQAQRAGARPLRGDAHGQRAADDLRADGEPPARPERLHLAPAEDDRARARISSGSRRPTRPATAVRTAPTTPARAGGSPRRSCACWASTRASRRRATAPNSSARLVDRDRRDVADAADLPRRAGGHRGRTATRS